MNRTSLPFLLTFSVCLVLLPRQAYAQTTPAKLRFLAGVALEFGGESVGEVLFTTGGAQSMYAGQGINLYSGGEVAFGKKEIFRLRGSVGYKYLTTAADNVNIRLRRIPMQLTANIMVTSKIRIGAGVVSHRGIRLKWDGLAPDVDFQVANGLMAEVAYRGIGVSFTPMQYTDQDGNSFNASAFGITFSGVIARD